MARLAELETVHLGSNQLLGYSFSGISGLGYRVSGLAGVGFECRRFGMEASSGCAAVVGPGLAKVTTVATSSLRKQSLYSFSRSIFGSIVSIKLRSATEGAFLCKPLQE